MNREELIQRYENLEKEEEKTGNSFYKEKQEIVDQIYFILIRQSKND